MIRPMYLKHQIFRWLARQLVEAAEPPTDMSPAEREKFPQLARAFDSAKAHEVKPLASLRELSEAPPAIEEVKARRQRATDQVIEDVRKEVETTQLTDEMSVARRHQARKAPGRGRKACPKCHEVCGASTAKCDCGYRFGFGKKKGAA